MVSNVLRCCFIWLNMVRNDLQMIICISNTICNLARKYHLKNLDHKGMNGCAFDVNVIISHVGTNSLWMVSLYILWALDLHKRSLHKTLLLFDKHKAAEYKFFNKKAGHMISGSKLVSVKSKELVEFTDHIENSFDWMIFDMIWWCVLIEAKKKIFLVWHQMVFDPLKSVVRGNFIDLLSCLLSLWFFLGMYQSDPIFKKKGFHLLDLCT